MAAHEGCILMAERNVQRRAGTAALRRVGCATFCPVSRWVSSTTVTILRMTALIYLASLPIRHALYPVSRFHEAPATHALFRSFQPPMFHPVDATPRLRSIPPRI